MKKLIALFATVLTIASISLANVSPDRALEHVVDPTNPADPGYYQCINPGSNCDGGSAILEIN